jgi:superfamily II DNA or RNA helicase
MPRIFDNIDRALLPALRETLKLSQRSDFCIGYFNLRGWKSIVDLIDNFSGIEGNKCRLLIGMQNLPQDEVRTAFKIIDKQEYIDQRTAISLKKKLAFEFRKQLTYGLPTKDDEIALRRLSKQLKNRKLIVKYFLRFKLHAKLYLCFRDDPINPRTGFIGSSNLTFAGLQKQGELNIDVLDHDATQKLAEWFEDRWNDHWCIDITEELINILEQSWAGERLIQPYHIYLKIAYHLSREAREGIMEFKIPREFDPILFDFQRAAVQIATHHLHRRNGVLIGDVVGLGKTYMATAVARIIFDDFHWRILILCPSNLKKMWEDYCDEFQLPATILSHAQTLNELPDLKRHHLVIIDESHNFRNPQGKRYQTVRDYIYQNDCKVVLLSATPYNKSFRDLSAQLRLFIDESVDLGVRPEGYIRQIGGETEYLKKHQAPIRSIGAFEWSEVIDDWRELMRLFLVRRTRTFIIDNYALFDEYKRPYLKLPNDERRYFPKRIPKNVTFSIDESDPEDQYAKLYSDEVVGIINSLYLARYGLANYIEETPKEPPNKKEQEILNNLSKAGWRLKGFCRTNLFKRLESSGEAFILSVIRHIQRNFVFIHAIENGLELPIGTQESQVIDTRFTDEEDGDGDKDMIEFSEEAFRKHADRVYSEYQIKLKSRFQWIRSDLFREQLKQHLLNDAKKLIKILEICTQWNPETDKKLDALESLLTKKHKDEKVLVFSQFADTVRYLERALKERGYPEVVGVTGQNDNPTAIAYRFSPDSNNKRDKVKPEDEIRVLLTTDVLSEGQNLQDGYIVVNYDLPWAIIRLIQRVGRVDRIGQKSERIFSYSFKPTEGVERIIKLRSRLLHRLQENAEVVGTDEEFFPDQRFETIVDLYNEKAGILDDVADTEVDLASYAYEIWNKATKDNPKIEKEVKAIENVSFATKKHISTDEKPSGVLVYVKTANGTDALTWVDDKGEIVTESQFAILKAAECGPEEPALERRDDHYDLVEAGVKKIVEEQGTVNFAGGNLGRPSGARFKTYERLKTFLEDNIGTIWDRPELHKAVEEIYKYPLKQSAVDKLNRHLKSGIDDYYLAELVTSLSQSDLLCNIHEDDAVGEPQIICSMGLVGE